MSGHTPGPWIIRAGVYDINPETACEFPHGPEITGANDETIAWCPMYSEADARLIAAAPFMLVALKDLSNEIGGQYRIAGYEYRATNTEYVINKLEQARAAIAKVEGQSVA